MTPAYLPTRANRLHWLKELRWLSKLPLQKRLELRRQGARREFLPVRPIWGLTRGEK